MQELPTQRRFVAVDPGDRSISIAQGPMPAAAAGFANSTVGPLNVNAYELSSCSQRNLSGLKS